MQLDLNQIDFVVRDMEATLAFYRALGVEIRETAIWRTPTGIHHVDRYALCDRGGPRRQSCRADEPERPRAPQRASGDLIDEFNSAYAASFSVILRV